MPHLTVHMLVTPAIRDGKIRACLGYRVSPLASLGNVVRPCLEATLSFSPPLSVSLPLCLGHICMNKTARIKHHGEERGRSSDWRASNLRGGST